MAPQDTPKHEHHPTRWLWVFLGAVLMGGIALGAVYLARETGIMARVSDPRAQFWVFELGTGLGYFIGGFAVAVLSPGKTTREPMYAAMLAFAAQTIFLLAGEIIESLPATAFLMMLAIDGGMAYLGAWLGEKVTGEA
ncbi:MAG: hypothetical protein ABI333_17335 [bacterium]